MRHSLDPKGGLTTISEAEEEERHIPMSREDPCLAIIQQELAATLTQGGQVGDITYRLARLESQLQSVMNAISELDELAGTLVDHLYLDATMQNAQPAGLTMSALRHRSLGPAGSGVGDLTSGIDEGKTRKTFTWFANCCKKACSLKPPSPPIPTAEPSKCIC